MKTILIQLLKAGLSLAANYAATTPDPTDDLVVAAIKALVDKLPLAANRDDVLAAFDHAKASMEQVA